MKPLNHRLKKHPHARPENRPLPAGHSGNTGTILRFAACMGMTVDIIEPAGFVLSDKNLKRAGMDYIASVTMTRHLNFEAFETWRKSSGRRVVLASTKAATPYVDFEFRPDDILLFGRESAGCRTMSMKARTRAS